MTKARNVCAVFAFSGLLALTGCGDWGGNWFGGDSNRGAHTASRTGGTSAAPVLADDMVRQVQVRLQRDGYYRDGNVDGVWGAGTESALMAYQRDHNLNATGRLDQSTLQALNIGSNTAQANQTTRFDDTATGQAGTTPRQPSRAMGASQASNAPALSTDMVRRVQSNLQRNGYYTESNVDGIWGKGTESALIAFQRDNNLNASGRLDQPTLQALNVVGGQMGASGMGGTSGMQGTGTTQNTGTMQNGGTMQNQQGNFQPQSNTGVQR